MGDSNTAINRRATVAWLLLAATALSGVITLATAASTWAFVTTVLLLAFIVSVVAVDATECEQNGRIGS